jgi:hypothetical protein
LALSQEKRGAAMSQPPNPPAGTGLTFTGMTHLGLAAGYDLQYNVKDNALKTYLCVGKEDNRVLVTGTTRLTRQPAVLNAIDQFGKWSQIISLWMVGEKNGCVSVRTPPVSYVSHVKPYYGKLHVNDIAVDQPRMTYPGNGKGRVLSTAINNRYYFHLGGKLETNDQHRGFDCTTFPMVLLSIPVLPQPGYGKQLCDAAQAAKCDLEQLKSADLAQRFKENAIPKGLYILFSAGHVMLYNSDINTLYEFNSGGFCSTPAAQRQLTAPQDLWWLRKLNEMYRGRFT